MQITQDYFAKIHQQTNINNTQKGILQLQPGDVFKGVVENITKDQILLKMLNGTMLNARLGSNVELKMGQKLSFKVQSSDNGQIVIKPEGNLQQGKEAVAQHALKEAGIPLTKENMNMIFKLVDQKLPINKNFVQTINRHVNQNQIPLNKVLFMLKQNLQINDKNVQLLDHLVGNKAHLSEQLEVMIDKIAHLPKEQRSDLVKEFLPVQNKNIPSAVQSLQSKLPLLNEKVIKPFIESLPINRELTFDEVEQLIEANVPEAQAKEQVNQLLIKELLIKEFFIKVDNVLTKENIAEVYEKIEDVMNTANKSLSNMNEGKELEQQVIQVKDQLQVLQQVNQNMTVLNIPLQMSNGLTQGNLMIFEDKKGGTGKEQNDTRTALITLDTAFLGHFECYLNVDDKKLSCQIGVENKHIKTLVENKINQLSNQLQSSGYQLQHYRIRLFEKSFDLFEEDEKEQSQDPRFSFDMRV
ncbi:flagellar hook-length control protein FliK [Vallitalea okinawensis]|uniref:flagellar hook-length control protein FliK n=1 Tax=Vallitalea okinawensis TaxID=2078660 RepID=UPI000CFB4490|nr:flagellar hook-length control protein FliK [Vallitalea okinawensis]